MTTETPYTGTQVAALYNVHVSTIVRWADHGKIPYFLTPGGHRRYPRAAIDALAHSGHRPSLVLENIGNDHGGTYCLECQQPWPCLASGVAS